MLCTATRPAYIQRAIDIKLGVEPFKAFDRAVTEKIMDIMGIPTEQVGEWFDQVHNFRALPLRLSGGTVRRMAREQTRVGAVRLARDSVARYVKEYLPEQTQRFDDLWSTSLPLQTIQTRDGYAPDPAKPEKDPNKVLLEGHTLGNIPENSIIEMEIPGKPSPTLTISAARARIRKDTSIADLILHTQTMRRMIASNQQYKLQLAAHCLSSSCANTGAAIRYLPTHGNFLNDGKLQQTLRARFGVPAGLPVSEWRCDCARLHITPRDPGMRHAMDGDQAEDTTGKILEE